MNLSQFYGFYNKRKRVNHFRDLLKQYVRKSIPVHESDSSYLKQVKNSFKAALPFYRNTKWHAFYQSLNNKKDIWYVPEDIFYLAVEPYLVNYDLAMAYVDKNNYENLFGNLNLPETVLRYIHGRFYSPKLEQVSEKEAVDILKDTATTLIVKPTIRITGGGRDVRALISKTDKADIIPYLKKCSEDFIIQKKVEQSSQLSEFNSTSVNTLRILTFRYGDNILHLSTIARFGRVNSVIDNVTGGGLFISVKPDGTFNNFAQYEYFEKAFKHPDSLLSFQDTKIEGYGKAVELCLTRHKRLPYFDLISWDVTIDNQFEPVMIELNLINQDINMHQVTSGPLFGDYSEEIIRKSVESLNKSKYTLTSL
ncbi:sugar-transfer associated ATP-grasp domain-containing protein [Rhodohalobacter sp. 8-1]|uniref:sugar-transfer associated ATP-grasp domain-containing protein n=1 Tax=Rhodohalobacter sp. 8-1 TaxID=3131972 RepID=UPI0030EE9A2A